MIVKEPKLAEYSYVFANLSQKSRDDVLSITEANPLDMARALHHTQDRGFTWVFYHNGKPAALLGARRQHGNIWSLFGVGTDDWKKVWRMVTLVAKRDMMKAVLDAGAHRAHCVSPAHHEDTHKWLRFLGATHEAPMPQYGKGREDYILFSWLKE